MNQSAYLPSVHSMLEFTLEDQTRCERECTQLCIDFATTVDTRSYDAFVQIFVPNGVFDRAGQISRGQAAIRQFLDARPIDRVTRHTCTNIRINMTSPTTATGSCIASMYQATLGMGQSLPVPATHPVVVDYIDDYVLTDNGWKFKSRKVAIIFQP
jgi:hypothetical protein